MRQRLRAANESYGIHQSCTRGGIPVALIGALKRLQYIFLLCLAQNGDGSFVQLVVRMLHVCNQGMKDVISPGLLLSLLRRLLAARRRTWLTRLLMQPYMPERVK